jgi:hypothetical protein
MQRQSRTLVLLRALGSYLPNQQAQHSPHQHQQQTDQVAALPQLYLLQQYMRN